MDHSVNLFLVIFNLLPGKLHLPFHFVSPGGFSLPWNAFCWIAEPETSKASRRPTNQDQFETNYVKLYCFVTVFYVLIFYIITFAAHSVLLQKAALSTNWTKEKL